MKILIYTLVIILSLSLIAVLYFSKYLIQNMPVTSPTPNPVSTISPTPKTEDGGQFCIQVITPAKNPATGECREFPTPCDVLDGWEQTPGC